MRALILIEEGLSENEELDLDEEMEDDGTDREDTSSDEDDDELPARRVRQEWSEGYNTADPYKPSVTFNPRRPPGPQLADRTRQDAMLQFGKEEDFFSLFFASPLVQKLCDFTNAYAQEHIADNPSYQNRQRLGFDICPWNVWFYCPLDFYGLRAVTSPRVLLVLCIIAQWQLGSSYDFLQGQV